MADADDVFACITPAVTRLMRWELPASLAEFRAQREARLRVEERSTVSLVVRHSDTAECLGMAAVEGLPSTSPEVGLWLKESVHGRSYGREVVSALVGWASRAFEVTGFVYPVAVRNITSRRIAESIGGYVVGSRSTPKYEAVVSAIPAIGEQNATRPPRSA